MQERELRSLLKEKKTELFGLQEIKLKLEGLDSISLSMPEEWQLISNLNTLEEDDRSSILVVASSDSEK